ncbi:MAG: hypothetical protein WCI51_04490 [Lentisphaerota bacterium]
MNNLLEKNCIDLRVSSGKVGLAAKGADVVIRWISGTILMVAGIYFLITF